MTADAPRVLALGDSYTVGEGVRPAERWPARLARRLRDEGAGVADPEIVAVTGWTAADLGAALDQADLSPPYALVTLMVGVNDQYDGVPLPAYRDAFRALLGRAAAWAGGDPGRVLAVSIPDWGATPFAADRDRAEVSRAVDAFNRAARDEVEAAGAAWVDVTPLSRTQGDRVVEDGLHPSGDVYAAWTELVLPAARAALYE